MNKDLLAIELEMKIKEEMNKFIKRTSIKTFDDKIQSSKNKLELETIRQQLYALKASEDSKVNQKTIFNSNGYINSVFLSLFVILICEIGIFIGYLLHNLFI